MAFIPVSMVVGPAVAVAAPFNRATILHRPDTFDDDIPAAKKAAPSEAVIKPEGVSC